MTKWGLFQGLKAKSVFRNQSTLVIRDTQIKPQVIRYPYILL